MNSLEMRNQKMIVIIGGLDMIPTFFTSESFH